jgi:hypothetical protein
MDFNREQKHQPAAGRPRTSAQGIVLTAPLIELRHERASATVSYRLPQPAHGSADLTEAGGVIALAAAAPGSRPARPRNLPFRRSCRCE